MDFDAGSALRFTYRGSTTDQLSDRAGTLGPGTA
jgi:hypothetical protein